MPIRSCRFAEVMIASGQCKLYVSSETSLPSTEGLRLVRNSPLEVSREVLAVVSRCDYGLIRKDRETPLKLRSTTRYPAFERTESRGPRHHSIAYIFEKQH